MKYNIIKLNNIDWEYIPDWWIGYKGWESEIPRDMLPGDGLQGFKIVKSDNPVACLWWHIMEGSKTMLVNPVIMDPNYREDDRKEIIDTLIQSITKFAEDSGCKYLWSWTENGRLANVFDRNGYDVTNNAFEIIKHI